MVKGEGNPKAARFAPYVVDLSPWPRQQSFRISRARCAMRGHEEVNLPGETPTHSLLNPRMAVG
jgi:hypothetical protein